MGDLFKKIKESAAIQITMLIAGLVTAGFISWSAGAWDFVGRAYASVHQTEVNTTQISKVSLAQQEQFNKMMEQLGQIAANQEKSMSQPLFGLAVRLNCCQGDTEPWVRINQLSPAVRYVEGTRLKLTKRTKEQSTAEVRVKGTFRADNPNYLLQLNIIAARMLEANSDREIGVMVELCP